MSGFVYFIRCNDRVKIGYSAEPAKRVSELSTGAAYPLALVAAIAGDARQERLLHRVLSAQRVHREWFAFSGPIPDLIEAIGRGGVTDAMTALEYLGHDPTPAVVRDARPFDEVFAIWPSVEAMATDLGVGMNTAQGMRARGTIAVAHWPRLWELPAAKAKGLTADILYAKYMAVRRARRVA